MPAKRILPCLDIRDGKTVKGTAFENLREVGDPLELAVRYVEEGADELVFLDITAHRDGRPKLYKLISRLAQALSIPFTVGGGVATLEDAQQVLDAGADKVSINSAAVFNPALIDEISRTFGSQALCVAIDSNKSDTGDCVYVKGGTERTAKLTQEWAREATQRGAGEILLTSISHDGNRAGFDIDLVTEISRQLSVPVVASGGAGAKDDFVTLFKTTRASAGLAAGIFHEQVVSIKDVKNALRSNGIEVRIPR
jgi:cyclase